MKELPMVSPRRGILLTTTEVAAREGMNRIEVARYCRNGWIYPAEQVGRYWFIAANYIKTDFGRTPPRPSLDRGRPPNIIAALYPIIGSEVAANLYPKRGKPFGAKNRKPYPKGVKRPRKKKPPTD